MSSSALALETTPDTTPPHSTAIKQVDDTTSPWLLAMLLVVLTVLSYWPTFSNGFVNFDDRGYVSNNRHIQPGLTVANISWAFRTTDMANWHPLTWISHMTDVQFFGLRPAGHHASSLFLHAINVALLFFLLRSATGFLWRSFCVAAMFALHPLNVECVAWISERKSLLSTTFLFLALFAYGWYVRKPGIARYVTIALLFALGLAAKPMIITLPFALLLLDYWPLGRLPIPERPEDRSLFFKKFWPLLLEKVPFFALSAASAYITVIAQSRGHAIAASHVFSLPIRLANAVWSYLLYILKAIWPLHLAIFYPHPENHIGVWKPLLGLIFMALFSYVCLTRRRQPYLIVGWLWYLGSLVPVIGILQVGRQALADRYAYTPLLGIFVLVVWWIADHSKRWPHRSEILGGTAALILIFFGALTWRQTNYWKDSFALFQHSLKVSPENFLAENNLGEAYMQVGRQDIAYDHFLRSAQEKPKFGLAHYNLGVVMASENRYQEARKEFQAAIDYSQDDEELASAYHNLGVVLLHDGELEPSKQMFSQALRLSPTRQSSYLARGMAEFRLGNYAAAEADFISGANLAPDAPACFWVGRSREAQGNTTGAIEAYRKTLALQPDHADAKQHLDALLSGRIIPFDKSGN